MARVFHGLDARKEGRLKQKLKEEKPQTTSRRILMPSINIVDGLHKPQLCTKFRECAFSHADSAACNALAEDLCTVVDPVKFRKQLKMQHYFTAAFNVL